MRAQNAVSARVEGHVLVVMIQRPEVRNAVNMAVAQGLAAAMQELDENPALHIGILTGAGDTFCPGMDLKAAAFEGVEPAIEGRGFAGLCQAPPRKPLIAAVEGHAVAGGFEIALACDLVVAARGARRQFRIAGNQARPGRIVRRADAPAALAVG